MTRIKVTPSSGNVFADLGFADAEERLVKTKLAIQIERTIRARRLTQTASAKLMGIDQPKVSHLMQGRVTGYSTDRLMGFLTALGKDVEIVVRAAPRSRRHGRLKVVAA